VPTLAAPPTQVDRQIFDLSASSPAGVAFGGPALAALGSAIRSPLTLCQGADGCIGVAAADTPLPTGMNVLGRLPPLYPEWLGDRGFAERHGLRFAYVGGAMANGIASVELVSELARGGCLGFFGAAGLSLPRVEAAIDRLQRTLDPAALPWGVNLIHSPAEPALEEAVAGLLIQRGVRCVEASAFLALTPAVVRYACCGLRRDPDGRIRRRHRILAKVSREEVARPFLQPPPPALLEALLARGQLSRDEAELAATLPLAEDITVEADSGGHTDNRPLTALLPTIMALRDLVCAKRGYADPVRVGAAGGLGTPAAVAAAFAAGADYVQTGSVNQACVESGLHASARALLAEAGMADVIMAPAADMFEMGVDVQVLRRGSLFAVRARKLYEAYRRWPALEAIPPDERQRIEQDILRSDLNTAWASTRAFWMDRDPAQVVRAESDPRHRMALVFRAYLGLSSRWAIDGVAERTADYQIWCGPAMGAFNRWVQGSFLAPVGQRRVIQVARNLLEGAAVLTRMQQLRSMGVAVPANAFDFRPRPLG
jgi:PfaD family protein